MTPRKRKPKGPDLRRTREAFKRYMQKAAAGELVQVHCEKCNRPLVGIGTGEPLLTDPESPLTAVCTDCMDKAFAQAKGRAV